MQSQRYGRVAHMNDRSKSPPLLHTGVVLGFSVAVGTPDDVVEAIIGWAENAGRGYVCVANVHMLVTARLRTDLKAILRRADLVTSDGMPLVWALRRNGFRNAERVHGLDLMLRVCKAAEERTLGVYFFGSNNGVLRRLDRKLSASFPGLNIVGFESPSMLREKPLVDPLVVERLRRSGANVIFVGLGCPKQEYWMAAYAPYLDAVLIGVGAAFDFVAGDKPRAPKWMQDHGLEWFFRLMTEPRRLWKRYLVTNTLFVCYLIGDWIRKKFSREAP